MSCFFFPSEMPWTLSDWSGTVAGGCSSPTLTSSKNSSITPRWKNESRHYHVKTYCTNFVTPWWWRCCLRRICPMEILSTIWEIIMGYRRMIQKRALSLVVFTQFSIWRDTISEGTEFPDHLIALDLVKWLGLLFEQCQKNPVNLKLSKRYFGSHYYFTEFRSKQMWFSKIKGDKLKCQVAVLSNC